MAVEITLQIPERIFHKAELLAARLKKSTADVLVEQLAAAQISSDSGSVEVEALEQLPLQEEAHAYQLMYPDLRENFFNHWVAIFEGKLLDHDIDQEELMTRLDTQYPARLILVRRVEAESDREIYVPSFRLAT